MKTNTGFLSSPVRRALSAQRIQTQNTLNQWGRLLIVFALVLGGFAPVLLTAQNPAPDAAPASDASAQLKPGETLDPLSLKWPRFFSTNGYEFAVYQPSISEWPGNQLDGRFAVATRPTGKSNETYGVVFFSARTDIDKVNRLVTLEDFKITKMNFPTEKGLQNVFEVIIQAELPKAAKIIPLDHLESVFAASADIEKVKVHQVDNTPPKIIYTMKPSLLVHVDGSPILKPLVGDYERVVNTRAVLLLNTNIYSHGYYLYAASNYYSAPSIEGPWVTDSSPPGDIGAAVDAALATKQVDPAYPRSPVVVPPVIYVATTPTELLETKGAANLLSLPGTGLLYVENTDDAVFYYLNQGEYYVLISGRWFKSATMHGPWTFVASTALPDEFKKIPPDSSKSNVLLSIAGTPQAKEAVIASTIPHTDSIDREKAKASIEYVGAPSFKAIPDTKLSYATNSVTPVIEINPTSFYACQGGVWFTAGSALGPWTVATSVPASIYTIPATSPIHYVTYTYVYGYTDKVVYVGYTPGYMGVIVAPGGTVVYGTGYVYPPVVVGTTYVSYPPTYGSGASFALGAAVGFAFGYAAGHSSGCYYEPHWGCYHYAYPYHYGYAGYNVNSSSYYSHWGNASASGSRGYNPWTGDSYANHSASGYNPYTGRSGSTSASASYNRYSGDYSANRNASGYNQNTGRSFSGSANASGNVYNGDYNASRSGTVSNQRGSSVNNTTSISGNAYNGTASVNRSGSAYNANTGNSASWNNGSMTADRNGNTYTSGDTSQNRSTASTQAQSDRSSFQSSSAGQSWSSKEASAQAKGAQRADSWNRSSGGGGWGGSDRSSGGWGGSRDRSSFGGGGGGWSRGGGGGFSRGGGGRRR